MSANTPTAPADIPRRRELDGSTRAILREEAEREAAARRRGSSSLEVQPDLGLGSAAGADLRRRPPVGPPTLSEPEPSPAAPATGLDNATDSTGSRRDLLPDIEEINSTLTATSDRRSHRKSSDAEGEDETAQGSRGFRLGFSLMLLIAALLVLTYAFAPTLARSVPALEPALADYVEKVNDLRIVVDGWLQQATAALGEFG
ncbi:hypothetical protein LCGC14_3119550 [marine sediment metagenome]|uniref:Uncharacterized protein n=1 Tax=marine sediment metagenome TaxID=412755 RepID=A0A0F8WRN6_9ZZZZ